MEIPFLRPNPRRLSGLISGLEQIEASGLYSNYGPVNRRFEAAASQQLFNAEAGCLTVSNATLGLMLAIKAATAGPQARKRYALLPSFTFAATAQAALWCGFTPLLYDVSPDTWLPDAQAEDAMLQQYGDDIAVLVPYATFGNNLDLERYDKLTRDTGIPVVVDAAASLGSSLDGTVNFGSGFTQPVVYSMHATKTFATAEGGLIWCANDVLRDQIRAMANFGFEAPRVASLPGLNAKLSEVGALLALAKLEEFTGIVARRSQLAELYTDALQHEKLSFQRQIGTHVAHQFFPVLLAPELASRRAEIARRLLEMGINCAHYFSPHLFQQPYFAETSVAGSLAVTDDIASRVISLPLADTMTDDEVAYVAMGLVKAVTE